VGRFNVELNCDSAEEGFQLIIIQLHSGIPYSQLLAFMWYILITLILVTFILVTLNTYLSHMPISYCFSNNY